MTEGGKESSSFEFLGSGFIREDSRDLRADWVEREKEGMRNRIAQGAELGAELRG